MSSLPVPAVAAMTESKALMLSWLVIILMIILDNRPCAYCLANMGSVGPQFISGRYIQGFSQCHIGLEIVAKIQFGEFLESDDFSTDTRPN